MIKKEAVKIAVLGVNGRMGRAIIEALLADGHFKLVGAGVKPNSPFVGQDVGVFIGRPDIGVVANPDLPALFHAADVVIDFTIAATAISHARLAAKHKAALVLGTTGLSEDQEAGMARFAGETPIIYSSTMSLALNVMLALTEKTAALLGEDYDIEILDFAHAKKMDAPSGTAQALGKAAAKGRGDLPLSDLAEGGNFGRMAPRQKGAIGFASMRGGNGAGEHRISFAGENEILEISHRANNQKQAALGALRAARWAANAHAGLFSMRDVLGIGHL